MPAACQATSPSISTCFSDAFQAFFACILSFKSFFFFTWQGKDVNSLGEEQFIKSKNAYENPCIAHLQVPPLRLMLLLKSIEPKMPEYAKKKNAHTF